MVGEEERLVKLREAVAFTGLYVVAAEITKKYFYAHIALQ